MENTGYVVEAAEALGAPGEIWLFQHDFLYDHARHEWRFSPTDLKGLKFVGEVRDWILRICDWLQYKYPEGPLCSI